MTTTPQTEASRLVDELGAEIERTVSLDVLHQRCMNELRRLDAALDAELANRDVLDKMLTQCIA